MHLNIITSLVGRDENLRGVVITVCLGMATHLIGLKEHVDNTRCTMAPVDKQVSVVFNTGRVIARGELQLADIIHAWLDQVIQV